MVRYKEAVAADIMTSSLVCARPDQDLRAVEDMLISGRISGVPVVDRGKLVGVISRSDIARVEVLMRSLDGAVSDAVAYNESQSDGFQHSQQPEFGGFRQRLYQLKAKDAMRDQVVTCRPETTVVDIADAMVKQHIHRVIVVDGDKPVGIVSSLDIVRMVAERD